MGFKKFGPSEFSDVVAVHVCRNLVQYTFPMMGWGLDLIKVSTIAGSLCGYPFFKVPLINKYFSLGGTFEKTNCLKMPKHNESNDMFL